MKISAVIASYNRRRALARSLTTLFDQDVPSNQYEIVVVVDGSFDGTSEMLKSFRPRSELIVVQQENRGKTAALNRGVNAASGEIVLFLDDDLICDRELISAHRAAHRHGGPTLVIGRTRSVLGPSPSPAERLMHDDLERYYSRLVAEPLPKWPDNACAGPNCSMPRAIFLEAGGYDEKLFPRRWEDVDLGLRLWEMGIDVRFEPRAITSHRWVKSDRQFWADAAEGGASMVRLCRKHPAMRSHSWLAATMSAPARKRLAGRVASTQAAVARMFLGVLIAIFEKVGWLAWAQRIAVRLFSVEQSLAMLAGAQREAGSWRILTKLFGQRLAVLLYHHVGVPTPETKNLSLTIATAKFRRQARWLRWRGYEGITPAQWLAWYFAGEPIPNKPVMITFDDAYADIAEHALPVVEEYGLRGAVFVITRRTASSNVWDGLPVMTMSQVQQWATRGIEIGAHTRTHPDLTAVSADLAANEVIGSKEDLMEAGLTPLSFAYPYGSFDDQARKTVDGVFPLAFTCEEGLNDLHTDPLLLRRTMVQPGDTILDIELRAALGRSPLNSVRSRLRMRSRVLKILRHLRLRA
jgi:GT2 family glycosyltransferase/peptidoglycan/xylan/chitin deacetylase (PgdA/CDA1 family)